MSFYQQQNLMSGSAPSLEAVPVGASFYGGGTRSLQRPGARREKTLLEGRPLQIVGTLWSTEEIIKGSVCDLTAVPGETIDCLEDLRMGARDQGEKCSTCHFGHDRCPGHPGRIMIPETAWFFHPHYVANGMIAAIMNLFCYSCFTEQKAMYPDRLPDPVMLLTKDLLMGYARRYALFPGLDRLKAMAKLTKNKCCSNNHPSATYFKKNPDMTLSEHFVKKSVEGKPRDVDVPTAYEFLKSISNYLTNNDLYRYIDFIPLRFENLVVRAMFVLPPANRPPESMGDGDPRPSDITKLYFSILQTIKAIKDDPTSESRKQLRDSFHLYLDSNAKVNVKAMSTNGNAVKTFSNQMDGKGGFWLKKTMSSRVDNSGRTPITGDNSLNPNEARIPKYLAEKFRIKLKVTTENLEVVQKLMALGIVKAHVNAKGYMQDIDENNRNTVTPQPGDTVIRRMVTGDAIVINRQPTLHRWSILKMSAVVPEEEEPGYETLSVGLNTAYLKGFNADFDGDEIHAHVPMDLESRADAVAFMAVENTPISDQSSMNLFAPIQNTVWGTYEMTKTPLNMSKEDWYALGGAARDSDGPIGSTKKIYVFTERAAYIERMAPKMYVKHGIKGRSIWNTLTLLSLAFPPDFRYKGSGGVWIENGILLAGTMSGGVSGSGPRSITQTLFNSHGPAHMLIYVHVLQQVVGAWMQTQGFTMSIADFIPSETLEDLMEPLKTKELQAVEEMAQNNVPGIFNRDILLGEMATWMQELSAEVKASVGEKSLGEIRRAMVFVLFRTMQVERNAYRRGLLDVLFRPQRVSEALLRGISTVLKTPEEIQFKNSGELLAASLANRSETEKLAEGRRIVVLRQAIHDLLVDRTIGFVKRYMTSPFDVENLTVQSSYEKATIEANTSDALSLISDKVEKLMKENPGTETSLAATIESGARGKKLNYNQSVGLLGQQTMSGARLREGISGGTRVYPFSLENDPAPVARGFIRTSFFRGPGPLEYLNAAAPARQTQTDTAFKTGDTGYMQKKLMAFCGDFVVCADGSVRDERGNVVTFVYGGDLIDPSRAIVNDNKTFSFVDMEQLVNEVNAEAEAPVQSLKKLVRGF